MVEGTAGGEDFIKAREFKAAGEAQQVYKPAGLGSTLLHYRAVEEQFPPLQRLLLAASDGRNAIYQCQEDRTHHPN